MRSFLPRLVALGSMAAMAGCNLLSGADAIEIDGDFGNGNNGHGGGGAGIVPGGNGGGTGGQIPQDWVLADGVTVDQVALYQSLKRPVMLGGNPVHQGVPLVEGKEALLRVFYSVHGNYNAQPVAVRLAVGDQVQELVLPLIGSSIDAQLNSTVNFELPGTALWAGVGYRLDLLQPPDQSIGDNAGAKYPFDGHEALPVQSSGAQLRLVLLPIRYGADGSNRLPDTSPAQVQLYQDKFFALYAARTVEVTVAPAVTWDGDVDPFGSGWDDVLNAVINYRQDQNAPADEYYYGIFSPDVNMTSYCSSGCVAGLSPVPGPSDAFLRAGVGLGFSGNGSVETAVHEVGHLHGRYHAPCSTAGSISDVDPGYPHAGAALGEWGFDLVHDLLKSPSAYVDMMSYCEPIWISDYNYYALFDRIRFVNGAMSRYVAPGFEQRLYERINLAPDGTASWLEPLRLDAPPSGTPQTIEIVTAGQPSEITGWFYPYSHLSGGLLIFAQPAALPASASVWLEGQLRTASRSQLTSHALTPKRR